MRSPIALCHLNTALGQSTPGVVQLGFDPASGLITGVSGSASSRPATERHRYKQKWLPRGAGSRDEGPRGKNSGSESPNRKSPDRKDQDGQHQNGQHQTGTNARNKNDPFPQVVYVDAESQPRFRRPSDLGQLLLAAVGVVLTLGLGLFLPHSINGLSSDLHDLLLRSGPLLRLPLSALASAGIVVSLAVLVELLVRRTLHHVVAALIAAAGGVLMAFIGSVLLAQLAPSSLLAVLTITSPSGHPSPALSYAVAVAALLTALGPRKNLSTLNLSWAALLTALGLSVLGNRLAITAALLTLFAGRLVGLAVRMLRGSRDRRGRGTELIQAMFDAGLSPARIRRVSYEPGHPGFGRHPGLGSETAARDRTADTPEPDTPEPEAQQPYGWQSARSYGLRLYRVDTTTGRRLDVAVLDQDSKIRGAVNEFWRAIRIREAMRRQARLSLRQTAEQDALVLTMAGAAGVRVPTLVTIAEVGLSSVLIATESTAPMAPLHALEPTAISAAQLDDIWNQLRRLHGANLAHRSLGTAGICLDVEGRPWLRGLQEAEAAASPLAKRLDIAQLLAALATVVGAQPAVDSAFRSLGVAAVGQALPLLQPLVLPASTRHALKAQPDLLPALRTAVTERDPEAEKDPVRVSRFKTRNVLTLAAGALAAYLLAVQLADIDFTDLFVNVNPWWAGAALLFSLTTYLGTAMSLHGVAPVRLRYWRSVLVQIGASFTALITPAGVGAPALNARYLQQAGVRTSVAVTSMALLQLAMLAVMAAVVLILGVVSGTGSTSDLMPVSATIGVVLAVAALLALSLLLGPVRRFAQRHLSAMIAGTLPRMLDMLTEPRRLVLTLGGILVSNAGYILTFAASLAAFGASIDAVQLVIIYLIGNLLGSAVPTPGGLGAVESSLILGLSAAGIGGTVALPAVLLFRLISFWLRVPFGWAAIRLLTRGRHL